MPELKPSQSKNVQVALRRARARHASPKVIKALVEAMGAEANYENLNYGDRDSQGVLQQRPSQGWGPPGSVSRDVDQFLDRAIPQSKKYGSAGELAQAVQRSAFPGRYNEHSAEATSIINQFAPGLGSGGEAPKRTTTSTTPGVDRTPQRNAAILDYFGHRGKPGALLDLKTQLDAAKSTPATTRTTTSGPTSRPTSGGSQGGSGRTPTGKRGKVIGTPYAGTHTLGNWQSDNAVDIAVPIGTPMVALQDGVVVKVKRHPQGAGRFAGDQVTIRGANGNEYFYAHGKAGVKAGQRVRKGQSLGTTGSANGVEHLHFGQKNGDPRQHT